jgi:hypothetical protein
VNPYPYPYPVPEPVLAQIGDIQVTSSTVHTPTGSVALAGTHWQVNEHWYATQRTPTWAIVAAIVGFCVLTVFSLLFLLVKETTHIGTVQVTVSNGGWRHVTQLPVTTALQVQQIHQQVDYVRSLAAW